MTGGSGVERPRSFHEPSIRCGGCGGRLDDHRDAICEDCCAEGSPEQWAAMVGMAEAVNESMARRVEFARRKA